MHINSLFVLTVTLIFSYSRSQCEESVPWEQDPEGLTLRTGRWWALIQYETGQSQKLLMVKGCMQGLSCWQTCLSSDSSCISEMWNLTRGIYKVVTDFKWLAIRLLLLFCIRPKTFLFHLLPPVAPTWLDTFFSSLPVCSVLYICRQEFKVKTID